MGKILDNYHTLQERKQQSFPVFIPNNQYLLDLDIDDQIAIYGILWTWK